ncbi:MAG: HAD-IA family hydrolase [Actinobacteria bacterium]|uniref:Unannotated protein n=1 Tax=freshwater metagenome TaxID=449393 RepID=A0A6J7P7B9_9ZZZZ|nr:HAD-IA family hydrolase [Actinomycetota bacterium]
MSPDITAVAFDFGGPVLVTPFERLRWLERQLQLPEMRLDWRGPFDSHGDPLWRQLQARQITERDYWHRRAEEVAEHTGGSTPRELFGSLYSGPAEQFVRPEAVTFLDAVHDLGLATAIFTNDLRDFQGEEWARRIPFIQAVDIIVDGSITGVLKPDPQSYALLIAALDRKPAEILYIDDQPFNVEAGRDAGLIAVWFDVTEPEESYQRARDIITRGG